MLQPSYPYWLASEAVAANEDLEVLDKFTGEVATRVALAGTDAIDAGIAAAVAAAEPMAAMKGYQRRAVLEHCVARFTERAEELALALCIEAGKPIKRQPRRSGAAHRHVSRRRRRKPTRITGEVLPLDISARAEGPTPECWKRVPIGPCSFISPFNFPLNLVAHKVAPALAVGCPFVLKPASPDTGRRLDPRRDPRRDRPATTARSRSCRAVATRPLSCSPSR